MVATTHFLEEICRGARWFGILRIPLRIPIPFIFGDPRNPNHRAPNHQAKPLADSTTPQPRTDLWLYPPHGSTSVLVKLLLHLRYSKVQPFSNGKWGPRIEPMYFLFKIRDIPASYVSLPQGSLPKIIVEKVFRT